MKKILLILTAVLVLLLLAAAPFAPAVSEIDWWAVGPSSSMLSTGTTTLHSVIGQGIAGEANAELCSGYLCLFSEYLRLIYMPLIQK